MQSILRQLPQLEEEQIGLVVEDIKQMKLAFRDWIRKEFGLQFIPNLSYLKQENLMGEKSKIWGVVFNNWS